MADEFLALPPVSNWMADYQEWLNRQPFLLRAAAFLILFNIIFVLSHYLVVAAMALFNCDNAIVATTGTCKGLVELKSFISERIQMKKTSKYLFFSFTLDLHEIIVFYDIICIFWF
jgi:hypothetical protein